MFIGNGERRTNALKARQKTVLMLEQPCLADAAARKRAVRRRR